MGVIKLDPNTDFDENGINKYTLCKYDPYGFDKNGLTRREANDAGTPETETGWKIDLIRIE